MPKALRDQLGFVPGATLEAEAVDGHLELSLPDSTAKVVEGPHGPVLALTGTSLSDEEVRRALEATRARG